MKPFPNLRNAFSWAESTTLPVDELVASCWILGGNGERFCSQFITIRLVNLSDHACLYGVNIPKSTKYRVNKHSMIQTNTTSYITEEQVFIFSGDMPVYHYSPPTIVQIRCRSTCTNSPGHNKQGCD